jgi:RimJ/RimL family protein N-acetyltransferase
MQYWGERLPLRPEAAAEAELASLLAPDGPLSRFDQQGAFCICDEQQRPIGYLDYDGSAGGGGRRDRRAELGIYLGEPDAWHQGYGPEAIILLLNWLFNHRGFHRAWLTVQANNRRAQRAYEKIGFQREGLFRQHNFYDGRWHDEPIYGLLVDEFNARYQPAQTDWLVSGDLPDR